MRLYAITLTFLVGVLAGAALMGLKDDTMSLVSNSQKYLLCETDGGVRVQIEGSYAGSLISEGELDPTYAKQIKEKGATCEVRNAS